jgi:uncharacterized protein
MKRTIESLRCPPIGEVDYARLAERVGRCHLDQRLGIEHDAESQVFGQGRTFFHIENWYSIHGLIRLALRLCLIHGRGKRNARSIEVRRNEFVIDGLPEAFEGFSLLHISDLHLDIADDMTGALADAVARSGHYDACVLTGDFRAKTFGPYQAALDAVRELRSRLRAPVYGILGNHDTIRMLPALEDMDIRMLLNETVPIWRDEAAIFLAGIDDPHYYRADNMEKVADPIPEGAVSILLSHSPEMYKHAAYARFDVMLSGHTHGGQICLPGGIPVMLNAGAPRAMCNGFWRYKGLQGYTSVGSGVCIVDIRLNCPPEVTVHTLRGAKAQ